MSIYTMGIDVGSTASKCVIMKDGQEIVAKSLVPVGTGTSGPARAIAEVLDNAKMTREQMDFVLATGYGRNSLDGLADLQMSELSCHAKGATYLFPDVHTVVDIGGQDVKVIEIENGMMKNFVMNDKCAAGTGRFLDVMARVLEVRVEDLGDLGDKSTKEIGISSVRGGSIVGDHEVLFCGPDEVITLKHTAYSRSVFANGAINAAVYLAKKEPGLYNMGNMIAEL